MALAASIAVVACGIGYWAGRQGNDRTDDLVARLDEFAIHRELSRVASGEEVELPFGHLRVISSYRLENGSCAANSDLPMPRRSPMPSPAFGMDGM